MTVRITLPDARPGEKIIAGIKFIDGVAEVATLEGPKLDFLTLKGAIIDTGNEVRELEDFTVDELHAFAAAQEPPIEVKKSWARDALLSAITDELAERSEKLNAAHETVNAVDASPETSPHGD